MRMKLKLFRVIRKLSQDEMSKKIGYTRCTYTLIEQGKRNGRADFWDSLQKAFNLTDDEISELKEIEN